MSLDRRSFLRGTLLGVTTVATTVNADLTALVKLATPEEAAQLTVGAPALIGQPPPFQLPGPDVIGADVFVCDTSGDYRPIGYLTELTITRDIQDHGKWDGQIVYAPGPKRGTFRFKGGYL